MPLSAGLILIGYTLAAWIVHLLFASFYIKKLPAKSVKFRLLHAAEIGFTVTIMLIIYKSLQHSQLSMVASLLVVLGTLAIVDLTCFSFFKNLREKFDLLHFTAAYSMVILVVTTLAD